MYNLERKDEEIDEVINKCIDQSEQGGSRWPGMTYEQGVRNALSWVIGEFDDNPMED